MDPSTRTLPSALARAAQRFEKWRRTRTKPGIPADLWQLATRLGAECGLNKTATTLRLNYYDLKRRVEKAASGAAVGAPVTKPTFVEVLPPRVPSRSECLVELEDARGRKMRIHLQAAGAAELAALGQIWKEEA